MPNYSRLPRVRMHREDQRQLGGNLRQRAADARHHPRAVHIARPVQRHDAVALAAAGVRRLEGAGFKSRGVGVGEPLALIERAINHHVPDMEDRRSRLALVT